MRVTNLRSGVFIFIWLIYSSMACSPTSVEDDKQKGIESPYLLKWAVEREDGSILAITGNDSLVVYDTPQWEKIHNQQILNLTDKLFDNNNAYLVNNGGYLIKIYGNNTIENAESGNITGRKYSLVADKVNNHLLIINRGYYVLYTPLNQSLSNNLMEVPNTNINRTTIEKIFISSKSTVSFHNGGINNLFAISEFNNQVYSIPLNGWNDGHYLVLNDSTLAINSGILFPSKFISVNVLNQDESFTSPDYMNPDLIAINSSRSVSINEVTFNGTAIRFVEKMSMDKDRYQFLSLYNRNLIYQNLDTKTLYMEEF